MGGTHKVGGEWSKWSGASIVKLWEYFCASRCSQYMSGFVGGLNANFFSCRTYTSGSLQTCERLLKKQWRRVLWKLAKHFSCKVLQYCSAFVRIWCVTSKHGAWSWLGTAQRSASILMKWCWFAAFLESYWTLLVMGFEGLESMLRDLGAMPLWQRKGSYQSSISRAELRANISDRKDS